MRIQLFPTCVIDAVKPEMGMAVAQVLERSGMEVQVTESATCCGQPAWNGGHAEAAARVARTTLRALAATEDPIVVPAGSCATMIRVFWRELFELHGSAEERVEAESVAARTFEFSEFATAHGGPATTRPDPTPTVYHRSCHMLRELGITDGPEQLLESTGAARAASASGEMCCGFGGLFSVKLPEISVAMADEVLDAAESTGATRMAGCDASCLLHLEARARRRGSEMEFRHLAEVMDETSRLPI